MLNKIFTADPVAWWGAITGTLAIGFEFYKWVTKGPKLKISISTNQKHLQEIGWKNEEVLFIHFRISNRGDAATTITFIGLRIYKGRFAYLKKLFNFKPSQTFFALPVTSAPLPKDLLPGLIWDGLVEQTVEIKEMCSKNLTFVEVIHSLSDKPITKRVSFK